MTEETVARLSNLKKVENIFKPDENGFSEWISVKTVTEGGLKWSNNGNQRHGIFFNVSKYIWKKQGRGEDTKLRTIGLSDDFLYGAQRPISTKIREYYKETPCVVCGSCSSLIIDHKNDLYNDLRVLSLETQTINDFQVLCIHCNLQKREVAKKTRETGIRYSAMNIPSISVFGVDFISGTETFDLKDINAMVGTYWYDPIEFIKKARQQ
jgi:5-methylcytosine-specific restriction endonuclease McrA